MPIDSTHDAVTASYLEHIYNTLLASVRITLTNYDSSLPVHYNLVMTRTFMMLIPRVRAVAHGVSANSMGMLGEVWVKYV